MENSDIPAAAPRPRGRPRLNREEPGLGAAVVGAETEDRDMRAAPRQEARAEMRDDPRAAAERRALEIMDHLGTMDEGTDELYISKEVIPDGWSYEWKRKTVVGKEDPAYQVALARTGWTPVPASRHPEMMPKEGNYQTIERKGLVLMERPTIISEKVRARDKQAARDQVRAKEAQLAVAPDGQFSRTEDGRTRPNIKKSYEAIPIPGDAGK